MEFLSHEFTGSIPAITSHGAVCGRDPGVRIAAIAMSQAGPISVLGIPGEAIAAEPLRASHRPHEGHEIQRDASFGRLYVQG